VEPFVVSTSEGDIHGWHYEGEGPQAVLLHGGPCISASYMEPLVPHLAGVFRQSLYQQRGLAPTTVEGPFTVEANVADAAAVIDETAGGRAWIVGHSWGGHLALQMLAAIPERVAGAIIVDPLGAHLDVMPEFGERLQAPLSEKPSSRSRRRWHRSRSTPKRGRWCAACRLSRPRSRCSSSTGLRARCRFGPRPTRPR
jgi:pimeloyl-ACP methyl ester carboxylesterase